MSKVMSSLAVNTKIQSDFPVLSREVNGSKLVYLDSAATTQKPQCVIDAITHFYTNYNSNIHRSAHTLGAEASIAYDSARAKLAKFINAKHTSEVIFTKGCTEAINLVAYSWGRKHLKNGDEIILSEMEHHANIVPWQVVAKETGAIIKVVPVTVDGILDLRYYKDLLSEKTKLVSLIHVSNTLGTINPVKEIARLAKNYGAKVLIDGAQCGAAMPIDVQDIDADFYTLSGHKMYGPTGIGVLHAKKNLLEEMDPYQTGGGMIKLVDFNETSYADIPNKFEAGTPHISGAIGLGKAVDYIQELGWETILEIKQSLYQYGVNRLKNIDGIKLFGHKDEDTSVPVFSFAVDGVHPHDVATILDSMGIAVRAGHHCCQPLMRNFGVPATARASFSIYNTKEDVDVLVEGIKKCLEMFS